MKTMLSALLLSLAMLVAPAFAQDAPKEDTAHAAAVEAAKAASTPAPAKAPDSEVVRIADGLSEALTRTASKLNFEIQDFVKSPAGALVVLYVVFKVAGTEINQWLSALMWLAISGLAWTWWARKTFGVYNEKGKFVSFKWWNGNADDLPGGALIAALTALIILIGFFVKMP